MNAKGILSVALGLLGVTIATAQGPAPAPSPPQTGPGVQSALDSAYPRYINAKCKNPPPLRGGGGARGATAGAPGGAAPGTPGPAVAAPVAAAGGGRGGGGGNNAAAEPPPHRDYSVTEIPGVIADGQQWTSIWTGTGNNADGIIASYDGGILVAQNTNSDVMKIDKTGKFITFPYKDTNTGGALSMNKHDVLYVIERGLGMAIEQLSPKRRFLANLYNGEPLECTGAGTNDLTADAKRGAYFTMGGLYYASSKGLVTKYGENLNTNGVILSPDEKTLYVTNGPSLVAFDVHSDGSLRNQREFAKLQGNGDGSTVDGAGRVYVTVANSGTVVGGIQVIGSDGKTLGLITTPLPFISVAFSGQDKKTLYGVANTQRFDEIFTIPMIAQGYRGRAK